MDARSTLQNRLAAEFNDAGFDDVDFARAVVAQLDDETVAAVSTMSDAAIATDLFARTKLADSTEWNPSV